jgi:hypothetical protein
VSSSCLASRVGKPGQGYSVKGTNRSGGDDLAFLYQVTSLVSLFKEGKKRGHGKKDTSHIDIKGFGEQRWVSLPQDLLNIYERRFFVGSKDALNTWACDSSIGEE